MKERVLIAKLNWFYSLELNQVELYTTQVNAVDDIYFAKTFARIADVEQRHVDKLAEQIKRRGAEPTKLGDVISPLLGKAAGFLNGMLGPKMMLKINIALEEKAMRDYKDMIIQVDNDGQLFDTLWDHLIDEDLHTAWMANKLKELEH